MNRARVPAMLAAILLSVTMALTMPPPRADATELVADISDHLVAITTGFTGADVLLFGAIEDGGDVAVVVLGPRKQKVVRRKGRVAGIWVNEAEMTFEDVPGFYADAASGPVDEIARDSVRVRHELAPRYIRVEPPEGVHEARVEEFRTALIQSMQELDLYSREAAKITFIGDRLFRVDIRLPATAPTGTYTVSTYLLRDGEVESAEITPLVVSKLGFEAQVFDFAHNYAFAYGVLAIIIAVVAGWTASAVFRKG